MELPLEDSIEVNEHARGSWSPEVLTHLVNYFTGPTTASAPPNTSNATQAGDDQVDEQVQDVTPEPEKEIKSEAAQDDHRETSSLDSYLSSLPASSPSFLFSIDTRSTSPGDATDVASLQDDEQTVVSPERASHLLQIYLSRRRAQLFGGARGLHEFFERKDQWEKEKRELEAEITKMKEAGIDVVLPSQLCFGLDTRDNGNTRVAAKQSEQELNTGAKRASIWANDPEWTRKASIVSDGDEYFDAESGSTFGDMGGTPPDARIVLNDADEDQDPIYDRPANAPGRRTLESLSAVAMAGLQDSNSEIGDIPEEFGSLLLSSSPVDDELERIERERERAYEALHSGQDVSEPRVRFPPPPPPSQVQDKMLNTGYDKDDVGFEDTSLEPRNEQSTNSESGKDKLVSWIDFDDPWDDDPDHFNREEDEDNVTEPAPNVKLPSNPPPPLETCAPRSDGSSSQRPFHPLTNLPLFWDAQAPAPVPDLNSKDYKPKHPRDPRLAAAHAIANRRPGPRGPGLSIDVRHVERDLAMGKAERERRRALEALVSPTRRPLKEEPDRIW